MRLDKMETQMYLTRIENENPHSWMSELHKSLRDGFLDYSAADDWLNEKKIARLQQYQDWQEKETRNKEAQKRASEIKAASEYRGCYHASNHC